MFLIKAIIANNDSFINPNTLIVLRCVCNDNPEFFLLFLLVWILENQICTKINGYLCIYLSKIPNLRLDFKFFTLGETGYHLILSDTSIFIIHTIPKKWRDKLD